MNPRQRRGVLLIGLALVGAAAVFLSVLNYVGEVRRQVGPMRPVIRLVNDAAPYALLTEDMIEVDQVPVRWGPERALSSTTQLLGLVPTTPLPVGTVLQEGMLIPPPVLENGQRELAILVDSETGVAGKINSGSVVDIFATFPGDQDQAPQASIVVENAEIIDVGTITTTAEETAGGFAENEVVPVTFALSVEESLRLAYIESFAANVRLALRPPTDGAPIDLSQRTYQPLPGEGGLAAPGAAQDQPATGAAVPPPAEAPPGGRR